MARVNAGVEYFEWPPPDTLARHVQCAWRLRAESLAGSKQAIYPDGRCELIVHLADPPDCWDLANGWQPQSRTLFAAQRTSAVRLASRAPVDCVGVRLRPAASALIVRGQLPRLRESIADLKGIDAAFARSFAAAAHNFTRGRPALMWRLMQERCSTMTLDARIEAAVDRIDADLGRMRIQALARCAHLSIRGLQSRFRGAVGLTAKEFSRLTRLQAMLRALGAGDARIADVAAEAGFADQAHATRELRRITGSTPARLQAALKLDRDSAESVSLAAAFVRGRMR